MGRLIDCNDVYNAIQITTDNFGVLKGVVESNMLTMLSKIETAEAIPKDQYESRLRADMVAMLTDIQLEIEELKNEPACCHHFVRGVRRSSEVIQQKIDALREVEKMTNGEKFKEVFKISQVDEGELYVCVWLPTHDAVEISNDWWNAEYIEPTTKNDLGVDKFDKAINQSDLEEWIMGTFPDWCVGDVRLIMNHMDEMPPVTEQEPFINKPCVSSGVCEHDKNKALDKIRAEIEQDAFKDVGGSKFIFVNRINQIIDKYKAESEVLDNGNDD